MRIPAAILAFLVLFGHGPVLAEGAAERLETLLEKIQAAQSGLTALRADFVQRRESPLLLEPEEAKGVFTYRSPDRVRWEYSEPDPIVMVIRGEEMTTWYRDLDRADHILVGRYSERVLEYLGASGSLATLYRYFRITGRFPDDPTEPYRLDLDPKSSRVAKRVSAMTLWIDPQRFLPVGIRYQEPDGSVTEYDFSALEVDPELPDGLFELEIPESVHTREIDLAHGGR